jgi:transposase-like protein
LFGSDKYLGLVKNLAEFYPQARWQRCVVHFYRNVWTAVPTGKVKEVAAMLKAIHAQEDAQASKEKGRQVVTKLREMCLARAAEIVEAGIDETLSHYAYRRNIGDACEPRTRWYARCGRSGDEREWWTPFPTERER